MARWMIYGAYGYSGELVVHEALRRGHRPLLAGRSGQRLEPLAERTGLEAIAVGLDDPAALRRALDGIDLVFHAAGPFVDTSAPMVAACLDAGVSYLDITGEIPVLQNVFAQDAVARARDVLLMPGVGFDVVSTDCLARYVADRLPGASELEIAIATDGAPSGGTSKSAFDGVLRGGLIRRRGELIPLPFGKIVREVRFSDATRPVLAVPWGDLESAYRSTGIPNITTYIAFPPAFVSAVNKSWMLSGAAWPLVRGVLGWQPIKRAVQKAIGARIKGPDEQARNTGRCHIWARAKSPEDQSVEAWLDLGDGYAFTASAGVRIVERVLAERLAGALTPAQAFGADFVLEIEGVQRFDRLPGA